MPDVPRPAPRSPLPDHEPIPATPWGPNPDYSDLPQRAGDMQIGAFASVSETKHRTHTEVKHLHKGPLGFSQ